MELGSIVQQLKSEQLKIAAELGRLDTAIAALRGLSSNGRAIDARPKRVMSASARRRIAAAQKARWAKWRKSQRAA